MVERASFDAWGKRRTPTWSATTLALTSLTTIGYTRHEQEDELGLVNMKARLYDPYTGRFLQPDTIIQHPDLTQGLNRYTYVRNNPLSLRDPTGQMDDMPSAPEPGSAGDYDDRPERPDSSDRPEDRGDYSDGSDSGPLGADSQHGTPSSREDAAQLVREMGLDTAFGLGYGADANVTSIADPTALLVANGMSYPGLGSEKQLHPCILCAGGEAAKNLIIEWGPVVGRRTAIGATIAVSGAAIGYIMRAEKDNDKKVPNPDGAGGKQDHKDKVGELGKIAESELGVNETAEYGKKIKGHDSTRQPDVQILDKDGNTRKIWEAERHPTWERNQSREKEYDRLGIPHETHEVGKQWQNVNFLWMQ